ncbi:hypothetical protein MP228_000599 [Amoeboaphelidium protococcarum]|nr:hypothetical protein MP228_000599 [Amoeboaphelidium protococcarum]
MRFTYVIDDSWSMGLEFKMSDNIKSQYGAKPFSRLDMAKSAVEYCYQLAQKRKMISHMLFTHEPVALLSDQDKESTDGPSGSSSDQRDNNSDPPNRSDRGESPPPTGRQGSSNNNGNRSKGDFVQAIKAVQLSRQSVPHAHIFQRIMQSLHLLDAQYHLFPLTHGIYPRVHMPNNIIYFTTLSQLRVSSTATSSSSDQQQTSGGSEFIVPGLTAAGSEVYLQPFRMGQRLFVVVLVDAAVINEISLDKLTPSQSIYWLHKMSSVMGGETFLCSTLEDTYRVVEKIMGGVHRPQFLPYAPDQYEDGFKVLGSTAHATTFTPLPVFPTCVAVNVKVDDFSANDGSVREYEQTIYLQIDPVDYGLFGYLSQCGSGSGSNSNSTSSTDQLKRFDQVWEQYAKHIGFWPMPEMILQSGALGFIRKSSQIAFSCIVTSSQPADSSDPSAAQNILNQDWTAHIPDGLNVSRYPLIGDSELASMLLNHPQKETFSVLCLAQTPLPLNVAPDLKPFGFIKVNMSSSQVELWVLPWDFPVLFDLLHGLELLDYRPDDQWVQSFQAYLNTMPDCYMRPLKYNLKVMKPDMPVDIFKLPGGSGSVQNPTRSQQSQSTILIWYQQQLLTKKQRDKVSISTPIQNFRSLILKVRLKASEDLNAFKEQLNKLLSINHAGYEDKMSVEDIALRIRDDSEGGGIDFYSNHYDRDPLKFDFALYKAICGNDLNVQYRPQNQSKVLNALPHYDRTICQIALQNGFTPSVIAQSRVQIKHPQPRPPQTYRHKFKKLRFISEEDELRDKLTAYGNPFRRISIRDLQDFESVNNEDGEDDGDDLDPSTLN